MIKLRVEDRRWQRLQVGVYAVFSGPVPHRARLWAAVLRAGNGAALSHQSAAELDGLTDKPSSPIHVTIPASRRAIARAKRQAEFRRDGSVGYRDVLYDEYSVVVELDGNVAHQGDQRWHDIRRDNASATEGVITLRYGYRDVTVTPCLVAAQVARVLRAQGWKGAAKRCSANCEIGRFS